MRTVMSILVVLMMAFALVSSSEAGWFPKDADNCPVFGCNPVHSPTWFPYRCGVEGLAYTDYIDARALPCTERDRDSSGRVTKPMGSPGAN